MAKVEEVDPFVADTKLGLARVSDWSLPSVKVSVSVRPDRPIFPLFLIVIKNVMTSPKLFPSLAVSETTADLITSSSGKIVVCEEAEVISTIVASFSVLPSLSSPSSEVSETRPEGPDGSATAIILLITLPV